MFRRRKKVIPESEEYIQRRYEDTAVRIYMDIKQGRGLYSSYVPWLQMRLTQYISDDTIRLKYWVDQVHLYTRPLNQAWTISHADSSLRIHVHAPSNQDNNSSSTDRDHTMHQVNSTNTSKQISIRPRTTRSAFCIIL